MLGGKILYLFEKRYSNFFFFFLKMISDLNVIPKYDGAHMLLAISSMWL